MNLLTKTTFMIKTIYFMFFICMFAVAMVACKGKSNDDFKNVSADEFEGFIGNEQIQIVDVRTVAEYSEGHIPGSLNINVLDESFSANADELLNPEQTIAVYCKSGRRSRNAAKILVKKDLRCTTWTKVSTTGKNWVKKSNNNLLIYNKNTVI